METYLTQITNYLLAQSWQIAILAAVIAAVTLALKNKSAHIRYLLWLIVLAKCLVPPLLSIPVAILPEERPAVIVTMLDRSVAEPPVRPVTPVAVAQAPTIVERPARFNSRQWLIFGWIMGVAVFVLFAVIKALRTNSWLRLDRKPLPAELQIGIEGLFSGLGLKRFPKIWLIEGVGQPFVWGLLRGGIYLPADFVKVNSAEHRKGVLGHELSHILRFDAAVNLLQVIVQAIFWFHPFVWWANKRIRAEREKCCDEMAIARLGAEVKNYSRAIVETLVTEYESIRPIPSLAVAGPVKNIEERIKTMLRPGKKFYERPTLAVAIVALVIALLTIPTALVLTARAGIEARKPEAKSTLLLHEAAGAGDVEKVKSLLEKGADVNAKDRVGITPLHRAAYAGYTDVVRLLIDKGADVNAKAMNLGTPLHIAATKGDYKTIELLLSKGADINAKNRQGRTVLFETMTGRAASQKEVVELLLAKGAKVPVFHLAAYRGDMDKLRKRVQDGIDINSQEDFGGAALHLAANSDNKEIMEFLINKGATVDAKDAWDWTPLHYAAYNNCQNTMILLLAKGANLNAINRHNQTPLDEAAEMGHKGAVELLIDKGADVNAKLRYDYTPLFWAAFGGHKDMVEFLIVKGANVNAKNIWGWTPLHIAACDGHKDVVELLIAKGADINAKTTFGDSVLSMAMAGSYETEDKKIAYKQIVELLRKYGAKE